MLLLHLIIGAFQLYAAGYVPKILLVARAHSVSPWRIIRNVSARRARYVLQWLRKVLRLDVPRLSPRVAAAVLNFRTTHGGAPSVETPRALVAVATGNLAELHIDGVFPRTTCFVQVDLEASVLRWTHGAMFIDLHAIDDVT